MFVLNGLAVERLLLLEAEGSVPVGGWFIFEVSHVVDEELFGSVIRQSVQLLDR